MLEAMLIIGLLLILTILFYPRRNPTVRRTTKSHNGQPWWKDKEPY